MIDRSPMSRGDAVAEVERFEVREFPRQILVGGSMPLPILRSRITRWIAQTK